MILSDILEELSLNKVQSIVDVKIWVKNYANDYTQALKTWNCKICPTDIGLPCICKEPDAELRFINLYKLFLEVIEYHKYESVAQVQLKLLKDNRISIDNWVKQNETIASEELVLFIPTYLDYGTDENKVHHLLISKYGKNNCNMFLDRNEFRNIIEFIEIFDKHFY